MDVRVVQRLKDLLSGGSASVRPMYRAKTIPRVARWPLGESEGHTVTGFPEDENPADLDMECPETFPEEDEWRSPPRVNDSNEFHSGEEQEQGSPDYQDIFPLTIEQGDKQSYTPLHSVS